MTPGSNSVWERGKNVAGLLLPVLFADRSAYHNAAAESLVLGGIGCPGDLGYALLVNALNSDMEGDFHGSRA